MLRPTQIREKEMKKIDCEKIMVCVAILLIMCVVPTFGQDTTKVSATDEQELVAIQDESDSSQFVSTTLKQLNIWEKANTGENGKFKAIVYYGVIDAMTLIVLNAQDDYFFSDDPPQPNVEMIQFKSKKNFPEMKDGQKVIIYFNGASKGAGSESFSERIVEYIEIIE